MNKVLDNYLCEAYPRIFIERSKTPFESAMGRGFECGNGYFPIINSLCNKIQHYIDWHNRWAEQWKVERIPQFVALQVKEKFGALRVYYSGGDKYCEGMVDMAASWSWSTCEICGDGGKRLVGHTNGGWIASLCQRCAKRLKRKSKLDIEIKTMLDRAVKEDRKRYE